MRTSPLSLCAGAAMLAAAVALPAAGQPCEPAWLPEFVPNGVQPPTGSDYGCLTAVVHDADGEGPNPPLLYVGGTFTTIGGVAANHVARWDGRAWAGLGEGVSGAVGCLAVFDDGQGDGPALFALENAFGPSNRVVRWDGASWSTLVPGIGGQATDMVVFDDGLGGGPALYIAGYDVVRRWDGQVAIPLGPTDEDRPRYGGLRLDVVDIDGAGPQPPALYALRPEASSGARVIRWDGLQWTRIGPLHEGARVRKLEVFGPEGEEPQLYGAGTFSFPGIPGPHFLARWDGARWQPLPAVFPLHVRDLCTFDDGRGGGPALYVAGDFEVVDGVPAGGVVRWDGSSYSSLDGGVMESAVVGDLVHDIVPYETADGPALAVFGYFREAGPFRIPSRGAAVWTGTQWRGLGTAAPVLPPQAPLYVPMRMSSGGPPESRFIVLGPNGYAGWDGDDWELSPYPAGVDHATLRWLDLDDGAGPTLYAARFAPFAQAEVIRLTPMGWEPVGTRAELAPYMQRITEFSTFRPDPAGPTLLVAGGQSFFAASGAVVAWDGAAWSPLGSSLLRDSGFVFDPIITELRGFDDGSGGALYAAGTFNRTDGATLNGIARLEGSTWAPVGGGFLQAGGAPGGVFAMEVDDRGPHAPVLYAGGRFASSGGAPVSNIARWNGSAWEPLGAGVQRDVLALQLYDTDGRGPAPTSLFVGGSPGTAGGQPTTGLARWDGQGWSGFPEPLTFLPSSAPSVSALGTVQTASGGEALVVAGRFNFAGDVPASSIALYGGCQRCPADYSGDGVVNCADISSFLQGWLAAVSGGPVDADFNRDNAVNSGDISAFLTAWLAAVAGGC